MGSLGLRHQRVGEPITAYAWTAIPNNYRGSNNNISMIIINITIRLLHLLNLDNIEAWGAENMHGIQLGEKHKT